MPNVYCHPDDLEAVTDAMAACGYSQLVEAHIHHPRGKVTVLAVGADIDHIAWSNVDLEFGRRVRARDTSNAVR